MPERLQRRFQDVRKRFPLTPAISSLFSAAYSPKTGNEGSCRTGTDAPLSQQSGPRNLVVEQMIPAFILAFSVFALVRFAVSQWRAIWITAASQPLSESFQLTAGIDTIGARDFATLINLCDQLSPELKEKSPWLKEVSIYYRAIAKIEQFCKVKVPRIAAWAQAEMQVCSRYVAVVLDQNLAMSMDRRCAVSAH